MPYLKSNELRATNREWSSPSVHADQYSSVRHERMIYASLRPFAYRLRATVNPTAGSVTLSHKRPVFFTVDARRPCRMPMEGHRMSSRINVARRKWGRRGCAACVDRGEREEKHRGTALPRGYQFVFIPVESGCAGRRGSRLANNQLQSAISQVVTSVYGCSRLRPCRAECNGMRADV